MKTVPMVTEQNQRQFSLPTIEPEHQVPEYIQNIHNKLGPINLLYAGCWHLNGYGKFPKNNQTIKGQLSMFWEYQNNIPIENRILAYPLQLAIYCEKYKSSNELDFIFFELKIQKEILELASPEDEQKEQVIIWVRRYVEFLEGIQKELLNPSGPTSDIKNKLCFPHNKQFTVGLCVALKDVGFFPFKTDYALSVFIEEHVLYENKNTLKYTLQEISKYRNHERECEPIEIFLKNKFSNFSIKTNDN